MSMGGTSEQGLNKILRLLLNVLFCCHVANLTCLFTYIKKTEAHLFNRPLSSPSRLLYQCQLAAL